MHSLKTKCALSQIIEKFWSDSLLEIEFPFILFQSRYIPPKLKDKIKFLFYALNFEKWGRIKLCIWFLLMKIFTYSNFFFIFCPIRNKKYETPLLSHFCSKIESVYNKINRYNFFLKNYRESKQMKILKGLFFNYRI